MDSEGLFQSSLLCRLTDRLPVRTVFRVPIQHQARESAAVGVAG
jgi:hypothetical protein